MDPCGLTDKLRDLVVDQIWEKLTYLVDYSNNIGQLNERLVELTLQRIAIQHRIDEARNNVKNIQDNVYHWLDEVDKISELVEQLHKESQAKRECGITSCPHLWLRYKLSKRAKEMTQAVDEICRKGNFPRVSYRDPPPCMPELRNKGSNEGIGSRVPILNQIMEALRNSSVNMIGLCGPGGVGKTTIAEEVAKKGTNQKAFGKVIMATVSQEMNIGHIQDQIIGKLGMQLNESVEEVKASYLYRRLEHEKNMLLILDDLWQELDLGKVGIPFVDHKINEGCKILLTSRDETLLSKSMKCQKVIKVGVLLEDEAWELFQSIAKLSSESSSPLKSIATEIVKNCGGLPLAIATAAKALNGKNIGGWTDFLARLKHPLARSVTGIKEVDTVLKLSYEALNQENKDIFLLSAMLSHDPSIEELLMYSVGLDILKHTQNMGDARNAIFDIVGKLKSLNLFLDSFSSHHFTMHDVVRDVALSIASEELKAVIVRHRRLDEWPPVGSDLECCKRIDLRESDICDLPEELHGPKLEFFLLNSKKSDFTIPNMFFNSSKELKVLAITNVHFSSLPSLRFLQKLKALCLHSCLLEDITEIRSLRKLKALSLAYSEIERLPDEVAELTSLEMLNLSHCSKLKVIPQKLLSSLKKLEVLYMGNSFNQWKVEESSKADENASLVELMDLPISSIEIHIPNLSMLPEKLFLDMNLKRYKIFIGKSWKCQDNYETSKILKLQQQSSIHLKRGVQKLFEGVEDLYLYGSNAHENVLHNHEGRGFPHLRHLQIDGNYGTRSDVFNSAHHEAATKNVSNKTFKSLFGQKVLLPELKILKLSNLNCLIPLIWDDQHSYNLFSNLKTLIVKSCGLVKLVSLHVLKSINNLEELDVEDCDMLEKVFDFEDLNDYKEMESSSVVVRLEKLKLRSLPKLKNVWSEHYQRNVSFPSLRSVDVYNCRNLTSVFPAFIAKDMLCDLEELQIHQCGVDVIVAKDPVPEFGAVTFEFLRLTSLLLSGLPNLRNFYPQKHTLEWPHLNQLSIQCCDELKIFEKEVSCSLEIYEEENILDSKYPLLSRNKVIGNLERLTLQGKEVEKIGSGQFLMYHFPKLKLLHLSLEKKPFRCQKFWERSPNLGELQLSGDFGDDVAALAARFPKLTLENISIMGSLSPPLVSSPNITHLNVKWLHERTTLMTSSIARSLVHLTHLSIGECGEMEEIITKQEGEDDENKEIIFIKLKFLDFDNLRTLKRFCRYNYTFRFPLLDKIVITRCPKFKIFSPGLIDTPSLKSVQLSQDYCGQYHREIWDTNLNKTFYQQRFLASTRVLLDEDDAIMIRNDQFPWDSYPQVEHLDIKGFVDEWVTFPYTLFERFPKLNELYVHNSSFEEIFPSHVPSSTSFHNLTMLKVSKCHQLVYLVACSAVKSLMNLEILEICNCEKLEEIVRNETNEDVEHGITFNGLKILKLACLPKLKTQEDKKGFNIADGATNTRCTNISRSLFSYNKQVLLPKLARLELSHLFNNLLSLIWDNSFSNLKTLVVYHCDFMKLVPLRVLKSLNNLEELKVNYCYKLEMVFGFEDLNDYHKEMASSSVFMPLSLTYLEVHECHGLTSLMASSAAAYLVHITHLSISCCMQIEEIITKQEGEDNDDKEIFFNQMKLLDLNYLPRLKRFCGYNYTFRFPLLENVTITEYPHLIMFCPGVIHAPRLQSVRVGNDKDIWMTNLNNTIQHLFTFEEVISTTSSMALNGKNITTIMGVFPEVRTLYVESFTDEGATFPYSSLERFPRLDRLYVEHCSFGEIFPSQDHIIDFKGKISPFNDLWRLPISGCHQLIHLLTTSIVKSLVSLWCLEIYNCKKMKEIVMNDTNDDVHGGITFNQLYRIELIDMPSLKMFSSQSHIFKFPKLEQIEISGCPEMKKFCPGMLKTPKLSKVKIEEHEMEWKDEGDLNKIMEGQSSAKDSLNI